MILIVLFTCVVAIACAIGWRRTVFDCRRRSKERDDESWMHAACLSISEGRPCSEDDAAVKASLATRTVFALRKKYEAAQHDLDESRANADRLAQCLREYVRQMDKYAMKLGDQPCALSREREALSLHQKITEIQPCPKKPS